MSGEGSSGAIERGSSRGLAEDAPRLTLAAIVLTLVVALAVGISQGSAPANPLKSMDVYQKGRKLIFEVVTRPEVALSSLRRFPDVESRSAKYLCIEFDQVAGGAGRRVCVGGRRDRKRFVGLATLSPSGAVSGRKAIPATVRRATPHRVVIALLPGDAGLAPARYRWRTIFSNGRCASGDPCGFARPARGTARYRVRPIDRVGCTGGNGKVIRRGPKARRRVALTFDDGPSSYTGRVLSILKRFRVKATFFVVGSMVRSDRRKARRIVAEGHEIANHSFSHPLLPSRSELVRTNRVIRKTTRFRPCLFRPPYGAIDRRLVRDARAERMKTILWNVDTGDWQLPGSGTIASIAGRARPGSIVLMHDGGGSRGQTVDALRPILSSLRRRRIEPVTVSKLLGNRTIYRPR